MRDILEIVDSAPPADPLSETTRRQRRSLLAVSLIAVAVSIGGLVPREISALGVALDAAEQRSLKALLFSVVAYFIWAFSVYAYSDWRHFEVKNKLFKQRLTEWIEPFRKRAGAREVEDLSEVIRAGGQAQAAGGLLKGQGIRLATDLLFPLLFGLLAATTLLSDALSVPVFDSSRWFLSPVLYYGLLVSAGYGAFRYRKWKKTREAEKPVREIRRRTEELREMTAEMRKAAELPEGSPEREAAKRRFEEAVKQLGRSRDR